MKLISIMLDLTVTLVKSMSYPLFIHVSRRMGMMIAIQMIVMIVDG